MRRAHGCCKEESGGDAMVGHQLEPGARAAPAAGPAVASAVASAAPPAHLAVAAVEDVVTDVLCLRQALHNDVGACRLGG